MALVNVVVVVLDDAGQVLEVQDRPIKGLIEEGKTVYALRNLIMNFGKTAVSQGKTFTIDNAIFVHKVNESPHLTDEQKAKYVDLIEGRGVLDSIGAVRARDVPEYRAKYIRVSDAPPTPKKIVTIFVDP